LICTLHLAKRAREGPITGRELASRERLPPDYVEQIMLRLRRANVVHSTRGARGGYVLARPAEFISVREVIAASELATFDLHCVSHPVDAARCAESESCSIRPVWVLLQQKIDEVLDGVEAVTAEANSAKEAGIDGVPCFIFAGTMAVSGAQSPEIIAQGIERAAAEIAKRVMAAE